MAASHVRITPHPGRHARSCLAYGPRLKPLGQAGWFGRIETSDGEVRHVQAGSFVLVEDTHGKGHPSRQFLDAQTVMWISLPSGLDFTPV